MDLKSVRVRDFQSVKDVEVDFGAFTVLVGPSNSGKSAFLRGVRTVVRNSFVPSNVRQGTSKSIVDLVLDDSQVTIERGKSLSTYKLNNGSDVYTKSAKTVPADVAKALRFPLIEGVDPSFAFQFDKPFLLAETGSTAAQVIGSLTNVSVLHAAIREANRRRQEALSTLKVRQSDVVRLGSQVESFRDLPARKKSLDLARAGSAEAIEIQFKIDQLNSACLAVMSADEKLSQLEAERPPDISVLLTEAEQLSVQLSSLRLAAGQITTIRDILKTALGRAKAIKVQIEQSKEDYDNKLRASGTCPTCQQPIH